VIAAWTWSLGSTPEQRGGLSADQAITVGTACRPSLHDPGGGVDDPGEQELAIGCVRNIRRASESCCPVATRGE
jgi:hypothetical protein